MDPRLREELGLPAGIQGKCEPGPVWRNGQVRSVCSRASEMMPEPLGKSETGQPLGNEDREDQGRRSSKPPAGPELRVQSRGAGKERTQSLSPVIRQPCLLRAGHLSVHTDFFGVCRGAGQPAAPRDGARPLRELTPAHPTPQPASLQESPTQSCRPAPFSPCL